MKGQVLGFDGSTGAITGEDGKRYRFSKEQWRDDRPAAAKDHVDFVAEGEQATEIYRLKPAFAVNMPDASFVDGDKLELIKGYAARPQLLLAIMLLLSCLFLDFMEGSDDSSLPMVEVHTIYSQLSTALDQQRTMTEQLLGGPNIGPHLYNRETIEDQIAQRRQENELAAGKRLFSIVSMLAYALWLVPAGAAFIIYREIRNARSRSLELLVGVGAILSLGFIPLTRFALSKVSDGIMGYALNTAAAYIGFSFGSFVIGAVGFGLALTAMNRIKRTPGL